MAELSAIEKWQETLTPEQLREVTSKAGKASVKAKNKKRELKRYLEVALEIMDENGVDNYTKITSALLAKAIEGDVQAYNTLRDTIGQKPKDAVELSTQDSINIKIDG